MARKKRKGVRDTEDPATTTERAIEHLLKNAGRKKKRKPPKTIQRPHGAWYADQEFDDPEQRT